MSIKTDRLAALLPDAYAAREGGSLLHGVLDAVGAELMRGDAAVKALLKSHWIDYAEGGGLDGLAALLGVRRRLLPDGSPEGDDTFRPLIKSTVPSYIGGGTVAAVQGAVRAALGLPYDLELFRQQLLAGGGSLTPALLRLLAGLAELVRVEEFAPKQELMLGDAEPQADGTHLVLDLDFASTEPLPPRIEWRFTRGGGRRLELRREDSGAGLRSLGSFEVPEGATLVLAGGDSASFSASIGSTDVSERFIALDGGAPALPPVPSGPSRWHFVARQAALYDLSAFDDAQTLDAAAFSVRMQWLRLQPLVFDVIVPYFVDAAVQRLLADTGQAGRFKLFRGLSLDAMQRVVDRARAAGVQGRVQYAIRLPAESDERLPWDDQAAQERFGAWLDHAAAEDAAAAEALTLGALDSQTERHDSAERFAIGGIYNVAVFDGSFGFH